ncbi:hypothetical protein FSARC_2285 [Fusarium sarcochroum]|uniref:DNA2/NAM7 helicase-like C-terminal domain-containing protein n=1 Tax=Fusarium sarcochroum TaxID=1208366 RepID=A0A8H4XD40_9HYPO|nr:hypothetical protein FSARC_2285 [Fusarium sarcochroum]
MSLLTPPPPQCDKAIELVVAIQARVGIAFAEMVFVTPYRGNLHCLEECRNKKASEQPGLRDVVINTTESFQGREGSGLGRHGNHRSSDKFRKYFDEDLVDVVLSQLFSAAEERFRQYLDATETLAIVTLLCLEKYGRLYGSAPTHVATSNLAERVSAVVDRVVQKYNEKYLEHQRHLLTIIRGYSLRTKASAVVIIVRNEASANVSLQGVACIARGQFDLARNLICQDVEDFELVSLGDPVCGVAGDRLLVQGSAWAIGGPPVDGTALPVFINCPASVCLFNEDGSRYNPDQNYCAVWLIRELITKLGLGPEDIVAITPYRTNPQHLEQALEEKAPYPVGPASISDVAVTTTDSFQGREGKVVVLVLVVTQDTGPQFVANRHRICVGITRHIGALFVVGDIDIVPAGAPAAVLNRAEDHEGDEGEVESVKADIFGNFLQYFRDNRDVIAFTPDNTVVGSE